MSEAPRLRAAFLDMLVARKFLIGATGVTDSEIFEIVVRVSPRIFDALRADFTDRYLYAKRTAADDVFQYGGVTVERIRAPQDASTLRALLQNFTASRQRWHASTGEPIHVTLRPPSDDLYVSLWSELLARYLPSSTPIPDSFTFAEIIVERPIVERPNPLAKLLDPSARTLRQVAEILVDETLRELMSGRPDLVWAWSNQGSATTRAEIRKTLIQLVDFRLRAEIRK